MAMVITWLLVRCAWPLSRFTRMSPGGMLLVQLVGDISPASYKPRSFLAKWIDSTDVDRIIPRVSLREALASQGALSSAG